MLVPEAGSPKFQFHPVMVPLLMEELSVKYAESIKHCAVFENAAKGFGLTVMVCEIESRHPKAVPVMSVTV